MWCMLCIPAKRPFTRTSVSNYVIQFDDLMETSNRKQYKSINRMQKNQTCNWKIIFKTRVQVLLHKEIIQTRFQSASRCSAQVQWTNLSEVSCIWATRVFFSSCTEAARCSPSRQSSTVTTFNFTFNSKANKPVPPPTCRHFNMSTMQCTIPQILYRIVDTGTDQPAKT